MWPIRKAFLEDAYLADSNENELEEISQILFIPLFRLINEVSPKHATSLRYWNEDYDSLLLALAVAADLKGLVAYELGGPTFSNSLTKILDRGPCLLRIAATGDRLSSSPASRESMVKHLLSLGYPVNQ